MMQGSTFKATGMAITARSSITMHRTATVSIATAAANMRLDNYSTGQILDGLFNRRLPE